MHLLFGVSWTANTWPSGTTEQTNSVKLEGHEAESHTGIMNPSATGITEIASVVCAPQHQVWICSIKVVVTIAGQVK